MQNEKTEPPLKLDQTFERKEYGFRFNYPSSLFLDNDKEDASFNNVNAAEMMRLGTVYLYFSQEQDIMKAAVLRVDYMAEANLANEQVLRKKRKQKNGTLKLLEKTTLDGQNCIHIKVTFGGGLMDTTGKRISEQYVLLIKQDCALIINYSALADQFEKYRRLMKPLPAVLPVCRIGLPLILLCSHHSVLPLLDVFCAENGNVPLSMGGDISGENGVSAAVRGRK